MSRKLPQGPDLSLSREDLAHALDELCCSVVVLATRCRCTDRDGCADCRSVRFLGKLGLSIADGIAQAEAIASMRLGLAKSS